ncbi:MAG TPA: winged helix-turn-helix transcriptional regulator [Stellaceae bacterium]|jgi:DNA-binding MarR family transcriptional regulator|nr:winged helix-turn-helix transcriptional regulator [Stellaceae bacterium]
MSRPDEPEWDGSPDARILLGLLESVERDGRRSQRHLAAEFGIALGLVNAYLKRCVRKGLVKVHEAPARRYTYYLTPQGFAEKSRLTVDYLSTSFSFFRRARGDCAAAMETAKQQGWARIVLAGASDLAEIAAICALECGITIVATVDPEAALPQLIGAPVYRSFDDLPEDFDGVLVTDLKAPADIFKAVSNKLGKERVVAPALLGISSPHSLIEPTRWAVSDQAAK